MVLIEDIVTQRKLKPTLSNCLCGLSIVFTHLFTDEERKHNAQSVVIKGTEGGLGIRIVGGRNIASESEDDFGIFVKEVIADSLAAHDGKYGRKCR